MNNSENQKKYNIQLIIKNIGPHSNLSQCIDAGENGALRIAIYATNGSGKSSISKQFRLLNLDEKSMPKSDNFITLGENSASFFFKLFNQNTPTEKFEFKITHSSINKPSIQNSSNLIFHTFNSDYVKQSIEPVNYGQGKEISGYIIGKTEVDLSNEKEELENINKNYVANKNIIIKKLDEAKEELQKLGVNAKTNDYKEITFENLINNSYLIEEKLSFEDLKKSLKKLQNIPENLEFVDEFKNFEINLNVLDEIFKDLNENITLSKISESFKLKVQSKEDFINLGINLINYENKECPFCEQRLNSEQFDLIDLYNSYINDYETKYRNKLVKHLASVKSIKNLFEVKINEFSIVENQYNKLKDYFPSYSSSNLEIISKNDKILENLDWKIIEKIIEDKKSRVEDLLSADSLKKIESFRYELLNLEKTIRKFITENNKKIDKLNDTKTSTSDEILRLKRRLCKAKFKSLRSTLVTEIKNEKLLKEEELKKKKSIEDIEGTSKKSKKDVVSETFESLIRFIFSDKYIYDKEKSIIKFKSHSLKRNIHDILSDGEKNIISFCYYIGETHVLVNKQSDYDKLFFIIDDPISSMDFHFTYSVCRILERLHDYFREMNRKNLKFILFTHSIEFMSILLRNNVVQKKYVLTHNKFKELKKELVMPYHEHLSDIYKVANDYIEPSHTTPNSMRHVLETISKFENPNQDLISFIDNIEVLKNCSSLYNMIQDLSHGIIRSSLAISSDEIKKGCRTILDYIESKYVGQLNNIKKTI